MRDDSMITLTLSVGSPPWLAPGQRAQLWVAPPLSENAFSSPFLLSPEVIIDRVVSEELWQPCQEIGKDLGFEARWWGPNLRDDGDDKDNGVGGVLVQLDTEIFPKGEELPNFLSTMPLAGLPTSPISHELARTWNIGSVIEHIEDFRAWLAEVERHRDAEPGGISGKVITVWGPLALPGEHCCVSHSQRN